MTTRANILINVKSKMWKQMNAPTDYAKREIYVH